MTTAPRPGPSSRPRPRAAQPTPAARAALADDLTRRLRGTDRPGALDVLRTAADTLLGAVGADVWCAVMLDPATLLDTGGRHEEGFPQAVMPRLFEIEHTEQTGVDNLRALTRRPGCASLLSQSTGGRLDESVYYRDILRPTGLADELRVLLRHGNRSWGLFVLCRAPGSAPFTATDVALADSFSAPATQALRRSLLLSGIDRGDVPDAAGLLAFDDDQGTRLRTATAERWLALIQESHPGTGRPYPLTLTALISRARAAGPGAHVQSRALTRTGHWITLSAWREPAPDAPDAAGMLTYVSLAPSHPGELTAIVLDAYGLTPREREVAQHVLLGRSTADVAGALRIAEYTVQDHLRKVFDKAGVRSRREFTGDLFRRCYLPRLPAPPLTTDGRMRNDAPGGPAGPPRAPGQPGAK
ncbi:helix-turn-helix transcriptional regulator [Streptomyces sp. MI02-7b]|uniref:helix-turn-helix transcriptional regulator n=1 Tax=Streptomyces sp. MI02-7b TaxID=462941 RepID=UPI0029BC9B97|nr:helix-turn-helix transcriptional regulator [Streptomyces sp. MI02-7b]MDX3073265.1 helix-turn-helix transcriptional regulator [Streptomyces sp. MI02-7b]